MARLSELTAFAGVELVRAGFAPRRWRGDYDGPQDFGRLIAFMILTVTLALLGYASQKDAILKIHQSVLGVLNMPEAPIPVTFNASPDTNFQLTLRALDRARRQIERPDGARTLVFRSGLGQGTGGALSLPGIDPGRPNGPESSWTALSTSAVLPGAPASSPEDAAAQGQAATQEQQFSYWALPTDSIYMRYYARKHGETIGDLDKVVVLNRAMFRKYFKVGPYVAALVQYEALAKRDGLPGIQGDAQLPRECLARACEGDVLRSLVLQVFTGSPEPEQHAFRIIWEDNLQTPVPVAALLPYGLLDQVAFVQQIRRSGSERDDLTTIGDAGPGGTAQVRTCMPGLLIVPTGSIEAKKVKFEDLPPGLAAAFSKYNRLDDPQNANGAPASETDREFDSNRTALRTAVSSYCGPRPAPLQDEETLFVADRPQSALIEFPQHVELQPAVEAVLASTDDGKRTMFRISEEQSRAIARADLLKTFQTESGDAFKISGLILIIFLLMTTIYTIIDRRVRSYALLEMVGFSRGSIRLMVAGQVTVSALISFLLGYLIYMFIVYATNMSFASGPVFASALNNLGYDDRELLKPLPLREVAFALVLFTAVVLLFALSVMELRGFGTVSPLEALMDRLRRRIRRPPQLIENLTRSG